jgi:prevent-host-death family protein
VYTLSRHILKEITVEITAKELRGKPSQIIEQASRGTEVVITIHGKKMAKLVPYKQTSKSNNMDEDEIFGIWKDRKDLVSIDDYVRSIRKRRTI